MGLRPAPARSRSAAMTAVAATSAALAEIRWRSASAASPASGERGPRPPRPRRRRPRAGPPRAGRAGRRPGRSGPAARRKPPGSHVSTSESDSSPRPRSADPTRSGHHARRDASSRSAPALAEQRGRHHDGEEGLDRKAELGEEGRELEQHVEPRPASEADHERRPRAAAAGASGAARRRRADRDEAQHGAAEVQAHEVRRRPSPEARAPVAVAGGDRVAEEARDSVCSRLTG